MHPILDALTGTEHETLKNLLFAFNAGDIAQFETLVPSLSDEVCPSLHRASQRSR
jgi:26S proteasome regulatory subunit N9